MERFIYLDNNATTPLDPVVLDVMMPYLTTEFGNASSLTHALGRSAAAAVEDARETIARLIGATSTNEIIFTSGATEAINMALKGVFERYQTKGRHFITCKTEHKSVLDTFAYLEKKGASVTYIDVDSFGNIDLREVKASIRPDTVLMAFMSANNETGVRHPVDDLARIASDHGVLYFCDATQSMGREFIDVCRSPIDLLAFSSHKMYGPKGIGALYIRKKAKRIQIEPLLHGGKQESNWRAGTLNVAGIVGFGEAARIANETFKAESKRLESLRNRLENALQQVPQIRINGSGATRLPQVLNITFRHLPADALMVELPRLGISSGSACVSGDRDPSHVLIAMGREKADAHSSIRISLGRFNTIAEIDQAAIEITEAVAQLRAKSPIWLLYERGMID